LSSFGGSLRLRLEREVQERGRAAFAEDLLRGSRARKGHALFAAQPDGHGSYTIAAEYVYADHNERQVYWLERSSGSWQITAVDPARSQTPRTKYGETAEYQSPEDVPVQSGEKAQSSQDAVDSPEGNE
jgi:hypothetical protein